MNCCCLPNEPLRHWWIWSHLITFSQEAPGKGEVGEKREDHECNISFPGRSPAAEKTGHKDLLWGADFPYWKHSDLAVSLGRTALFSALTETKNEHPEITVHRKIILMLYLTFMFQRDLRRGTGKASYCPEDPFLKAHRQTQPRHFHRTHHEWLSNIHDFYQTRLLWFVVRLTHQTLQTLFPNKADVIIRTDLIFSGWQKFCSPLSRWINRQEATF